ncbi:uncharacterized protein LOC136075485 isoform X2 [Hydra vulgaris]|uniref:Uncharacterized protein LOC136075485 isoform X2 n=1 Tax=Hydra vulgaris TaxID=6087 RepID=A0ABM4B7R6_HYDVU
MNIALMSKIFAFILLIGYIDCEINPNDLNQLEDAEKVLKRLQEVSREVTETQSTDVLTSSSQSKSFADKILSDTSTVSKELTNIVQNKNKLNKNASLSQTEDEIKKANDQAKENIDLIIGAGKGVISVITGLRDADYSSVVTGSLNIISSLLMFGGPHTAILGSIISLVSFSLTVFMSKAKKTQDQIILEGVRNIFQEFEDQGMQEQTNFYFNQLSVAENLIKAISYDINEEESLEEIEKTIFKIYEEEYLARDKGSEILGKLKERISSSCDAGTCNECLSKIQKYFILSIRKQIFNLQFLGLNETLLKNSGKKAANIYEGIKIVLKRMNTECQEFVDYFLRASRLSYRKCIAEYYKYPGKFEFIDKFLNGSIKSMAETGNYVVVAESKDLEGRFFKIKLQSAQSPLEVTLQTKESWAPNLRSLFVPARYQVKLLSSTRKLVYKGPTVVEIPENIYTSLVITKCLQLSGEYIRACQNADMDGPCIQFETKDLNPKKSITNMPFNPKSLYIPNGWKVHKITGESRVKRKKFGVSKEVAEFVDIKGPITLGNICDESTQVVELSGITQIGPLKNEIKICSRKNFAGWCDYIDNKVVIKNLL